MEVLTLQYLVQIPYTWNEGRGKTKTPKFIAEAQDILERPRSRKDFTGPGLENSGQKQDCM